MRTSFLQDLYLQKPITFAVLICALSVLPWIGLGDFATKGEPREAAVAVSMLTTGNVVLPAAYADEFAYKPPLAHWLMAAFSLPQGYVSEFTARLPSALALIVLIGAVVVFFGKRTKKFHETFVTACILMTCVELHRAGMTARVDMLLTLFIVTGLFGLYRWEEIRNLKGLPIGVSLLLGLATLTKGPVGIVLPLFVFGIYLFLLGKYPWRVILRSLFYIGLSAVFLPTLWYLEAWKQGGQDFLNLVTAENFGRFFRLATPAIRYELGHEEGFWYNFATLAAGFVPWTILLLFSLFGLKRPTLNGWRSSLRPTEWLVRLRRMDPVRLFSLVAAVSILVFYAIPSAKRSVYLMPAYPFIAFFLSQYVLNIVDRQAKALRAFAFLVTGVGTLSLLLAWLTATRLIDPVILAARFTDSDVALCALSAITDLLTTPDAVTFLILALLTTTLILTCCSFLRQIHIKTFYAVIALLFSLNLFIDGLVMRGERHSASIRPFAEEIMRTYPLQHGNVYVMNDLRHYPNLYGLNFYLGNIFLPFESRHTPTLPDEGYLLSGENDLKTISDRYAGTHTFLPLVTTSHTHKEIRQKITLSRFCHRTP
ncbi:MAG: dolichyl-phosphate-mannose--protein mannosyltransferase [Tannerellaceae bacterium]|jgi:4-amino-4-deoxy-L-arabinose transferase-like glycosyltransferase|nr:dolichyl-phosphate-mannose--protein mannosyltransferase [Tannerellaceae bacterium]